MIRKSSAISGDTTGQRGLLVLGSFAVQTRDERKLERRGRFSWPFDPWPVAQDCLQMNSTLYSKKHPGLGRERRIFLSNFLFGCCGNEEASTSKAVITHTLPQKQLCVFVDPKLVHQPRGYRGFLCFLCLCVTSHNHRGVFGGLRASDLKTRLHSPDLFLGLLSKDVCASWGRGQYFRAFLQWSEGFLYFGYNLFTWCFVFVFEKQRFV